MPDGAIQRLENMLGDPTLSKKEFDEILRRIEALERR